MALVGLHEWPSVGPVHLWHIVELGLTLSVREWVLERRSVISHGFVVVEIREERGLRRMSRTRLGVVVQGRTSEFV